MGNQDNAHHDPPGLFAVVEPVLKNAGIDVVFSGDKADINAANLAGYDAMLMYGNLNSSGAIDYSNTPEMDALVGFVEAGGALVGIHVASAAYRFTPRFASLLGGRFNNHQVVTFSPRHVMPQHPILRGLETYVGRDENYFHKDFNPDAVVIQVRDHATGAEPHTWVRTQGSGRVFYTAGGHFAEIWALEGFQQLLARGTLWASGGEFATLADAAVSADGAVTFSGVLAGAGGESGLWSHAGGVTSLLAQTGGETPGVGGREFAIDQLGAAVPTSSAGVCLASAESSTVAGDFVAGVWEGVGFAQENQVVEGGDAQAFGFPAGYNFTSIGTGLGTGLVVNPSGEFLVRVEAEHATDPPLSGLVSSSGGLVAMSGGVIDGLEWGGLAAGSLTVNSAGDGAFVAGLDGAGVSPENDTALCAWGSGGASILYREGDQVPDGGGNLAFDAFGTVRGNDRGDLLFVAALKGSGATAADDQCLFLHHGASGMLEVVAREGQASAGLVFGDSLKDEVIALGGGGDACFFATMGGAGVTVADDRALWTYSGGRLRILAREGGGVPGVPGAVFGADLGTSAASVNASGTVAFASGIAGGGVTASNDRGLWAGSPGALDLVLQEGDQLDFGSGVPSGVASLEILGGGGAQDGLASALNDSGQIVASLASVGGEVGVFRITDVSDLDGDGFVALLEYALAGDPSVFEHELAGMPRTDLVGGEIRYRFFRNLSFVPAQYVVELSTDLVSWTPSPVEPTVDPEQGDVPAGYERVYLPLPPDQQRLFARLTIMP